MGPNPWRVTILSGDNHWNAEVYCYRRFPSKEQALEYVQAYNEDEDLTNLAWYTHAEYPQFIVK